MHFCMFWDRKRGQELDHMTAGSEKSLGRRSAEKCFEEFSLQLSSLNQRTDSHFVKAPVLATLM
jgi:hypothetical protein